jgi:hypothetical protein
MTSPTALYVDLNCLLDTRLGTLLTIDPDFGFMVSQQPGYYTRSVDKFSTPEHGSLKRELYDQVLLNNPDRVIKNSIMTRMLDFIKNIIGAQRMLQTEGPVKGIDRILVNLHPYTLTHEEKLALVNLLASELIDFECNVELVELASIQISAEFAAKNYIAMIIYNPTDWLEAIGQELLTAVCTNLTLYTPKLNHIRELTHQESEQVKRFGSDLYASLETAMKRYIQFTYLRVNWFCAHTPLNDKDAL